MNPAASMLKPERAALVVVDLQEKLFPWITGRERVLHNTLLLLRLARVLELPVILTTQYAKGLGPTIPEVLAEAPRVEPLDKVSFGCFGNEAFLARLARLEGRDQLLVAGIESHICVAQTVLGTLLSSTEMAVYELLARSDGEAFRKMLPCLKGAPSP